MGVYNEASDAPPAQGSTAAVASLNVSSTIGGNSGKASLKKAGGISGTPLGRGSCQCWESQQRWWREGSSLAKSVNLLSRVGISKQSTPADQYQALMMQGSGSGGGGSSYNIRVLPDCWVSSDVKGNSNMPITRAVR